MPGPGRKPTSRRQRRNDDGIAAVPPPAGEIPKAPAGLLKATRQRWDELWTSEVARTFTWDLDRETVERLFTYYDEHARAASMFKAARLVQGSMGQPVLNPAGKLMLQLAGEIRQLEDRLGLNPKARVNMGAPQGGDLPGLDDLLAAAADDQADPRLTVVPGGRQVAQ